MVIVKSTSFEKLKPALDKIWVRHGVPEKVIHDGGPPYNSHDWKAYAKKVGFKSGLCTPEHPQANGPAKRFMVAIVKMTHAALADKKGPQGDLHFSHELSGYAAQHNGKTAVSASLESEDLYEAAFPGSEAGREGT